MKRRRRLLGWAAGLVGLLVLGFFCIPLPPAALATGTVPSVRLVDRHGTRLREYLSSEAGTSVWVDLAQVAPDVVLATLAAEDRRFWWHPGVDAVGVVRAAWGNLRAGHVESGASTLAMQWIGNSTHDHPTTVRGKAWQALLALRLMTVLSRRGLLERYLNSVPYGHQTFGIEAAARFYFQTSAANLSLAQATFLAAIPAAPTYYDPLAEPQRVRARQATILQALGALGWVSPERLAAARQADVVATLSAVDWQAPHFCDRVMQTRAQPTGTIQTTLDLDTQHLVEGVLRQRLGSLAAQHVTNGAVVVLDNASGEVLAWVGSVDYRTAQVDSVLAQRQPGSTLKPFLYGLALEDGSTPATLLPDLPYRYGGVKADYRPENYDGTYHGPVALRTALACSYNAPAVYVLNRLGTDRLLRRLHTAGFDSLTGNADHYGLGLTLGDGEVELLELANAYRSLANLGRWTPTVTVQGEAPDAPARQVFEPQVAALLTDILSDAAARRPAFGAHSVLNLPFPCAAKTGTSQDFRDNWTVGYTSAITVAVWVGNNDDSRLHDVSGVTGAGGIFRDVMEGLAPRHAPAPFARPDGLVELDICPDSGALAGPDCPVHQRELFMARFQPHLACQVHRRERGRLVTVYPTELAEWRRQAGLPVDPGVGLGGTGIASPSDGEVLDVDPVLHREAQALHLEVMPPASAQTVRWYVDGHLYRTVSSPFTARWPLTPGRHAFQAMAAGWQSTPVHILVK